MKVTDRYASAVHSSNLKTKTETTYSDTDVLGAMGLAGKAVRHDGREGVPLAAALLRLFSGDNGAMREIIEITSRMAWGKAKALRVRMTRVQSEDMARAVIAWHRNGTCTKCGGHGFKIIPGTLTVGDAECSSCHGEGKVPFDSQFSEEHQLLARFVLTHIEREQSSAGPAAMAALAPRLDL